MSRLRVQPAAQQEFLEVVEHLCSIDPDFAADFVVRVEAAYQSIAERPLRFARLETNRTDREIRRFRLQRFPYLVIYEVLADKSEVLAIMHASRHPDTWNQRT